MALALLPGIASASPTLTEFPLAGGANPQQIAAGPDGNVWFVETGANKIARMTPAGTLTQFSTGLTASAGLADIVTGPDGNLWFTENSKNTIGRITPGGTITEFSTGAGGDHKPYGITSGPDGRLWFTETTGNRVGSITTSGLVTEYTAGISGSSNPYAITVGPDGNLWFTERISAGRLARITTAGVVTEFPGVPAMTAGQPTGITSGPDGNLWFTENANPGAIGRMSTAGTLTEFTAVTHDGGPADIVAGDDGNLYFTEKSGPGNIGKITPAGVITYATGLTTNSSPLGITTGGDGNVWFTESAGNRIGLLTIAPGATTTAPAAIGAYDATLAAGVTPNSQATTYSFDWGLTTAYGSSTASGSAGSGATSQYVSTSLTGLAAATTYHYRVVATNPSGTTVGADQTFTTLVPAPVADTGLASAVDQVSATLNATVNPNAAATTYWFEWGLTTAYGSSTTTSSAGSGSSPQPASKSITGLALGTTYHYRVVATNTWGTTMGADQTFTTLVPSPLVTTSAASAVDQVSATLNAMIDPDGASTTYWFEWGLTRAYGSSTNPGGPVSSPQAASSSIAGLAPGTTYHYRVVATNTWGTTMGGDQTFTTLVPAPLVATGAATAVDQGGATLAGTVNPNGAPTAYHFDLGLTTAYGARWPASDASAGADNVVHSLLQVVTGLVPGMTYHYRVVATNSTGTNYGDDQSFSTVPALLTPIPALPALIGSPSLPPVTRPVLGRSATVAAVSGTVMVELPGADTYLPLNRPSTVPVGSTIDASKGRIRLTNVRDGSGKLQTGTFWGGSFTIHQTRTKRALTVIALAGATCTKARQLAGASANAPRVRNLWAHDNHGRFVTRGHSAVATVRGTTWFTQERCNGTLVKVSRGAVSVRDLVRHRTVIVLAGQSYLARNR